MEKTVVAKMIGELKSVSQSLTEATSLWSNTGFIPNFGWSYQLSFGHLVKTLVGV